MANLHKKSVFKRIVVGKLIGLVVGGISFAMLPLYGLAGETMFGLGMWLAFILMGGTIGLLGIMTQHPIFDFRLRFWMRGAVVGFSFMLMVILLGYEQIQAIMSSPLVSWVGLKSPFWALIDGTLIGIFMGWVATKVAGEGDIPAI